MSVPRNVLELLITWLGLELKQLYKLWYGCLNVVEAYCQYDIGEKMHVGGAVWFWRQQFKCMSVKYIIYSIWYTVYEWIFLYVGDRNSTLECTLFFQNKIFHQHSSLQHHRYFRVGCWWKFLFNMHFHQYLPSTLKKPYNLYGISDCKVIWTLLPINLKNSYVNGTSPGIEKNWSSVILNLPVRGNNIPMLSTIQFVSNTPHQHRRNQHNKLNFSLFSC